MGSASSGVVSATATVARGCGESSAGCPVIFKMDDSKLISMIADEDTLVGFLLAGVGDLDPAHGQNFLVVDGNTPIPQIEDKFGKLTKREDIAMVMINQWIAEKIDHTIKAYDKIIPTIIVIPSKDKP